MTVVPAVAAAVAFVVPGNDTLGLLLGWVLGVACSATATDAVALTGALALWENWNPATAGGPMTDSIVSARQSPLTAQFARDWAEQFLGAWNSHDPERLAALSTADVRWEDPFIHPSGVLQGRDELHGWLTSIWRALPDLTFRLAGDPFISLDGTQLGAAWTGTARFAGPLDPPGFAPTGSVIEMAGFDVHEFRDGLLSHVVTTTDVTAVARQIGAAPPPNSLGEKVGVAVQRLMAKRLSRKR